MKTYSAYMIRCWKTEDSERFVAQHIQSGTQFHAATLEEVNQWIRQTNESLVPNSSTGEEEEEEAR